MEVWWYKVKQHLKHIQDIYIYMYQLLQPPAFFKNHQKYDSIIKQHHFSRHRKNLTTPKVFHRTRKKILDEEKNIRGVFAQGAHWRREPGAEIRNLQSPNHTSRGMKNPPRRRSIWGFPKMVVPNNYWFSY